jgi:hypothetical protein
MLLIGPTRDRMANDESTRRDQFADGWPNGKASRC